MGCLCTVCLFLVISVWFILGVYGLFVYCTFVSCYFSMVYTRRLWVVCVLYICFLLFQYGLYSAFMGCLCTVRLFLVISVWFILGVYGLFVYCTFVSCCFSMVYTRRLWDVSSTVWWARLRTLHWDRLPSCHWWPLSSEPHGSTGTRPSLSFLLCSLDSYSF